MDLKNESKAIESSSADENGNDALLGFPEPSTFLETTPSNLLVTKTPEGFRRIRGGSNRSISSQVDGIYPVKPSWSNASKRASSYAAAVSAMGDGFNRQQQNSQQAVELQVTNLDQSIDQREMKRIISAIFREHVQVLHVSVFFQSDGNMAACVRVQDMQQAQYAISQLHRKKIGYKRILISYSHNHNQKPSIVRSKVIAILSDVPGGKLQLFKFREMYEKRYHSSIGVSDLYKMKDIVVISEDLNGRMIQLNTSHSSSGLGSLGRLLPRTDDILEVPFCPIHPPDQPESKGWAERETGTQLPNVNVSLSLLGPNIHQLVKDHEGDVPLRSLMNCYEAQFGPLPQDNEDGVPLEHLVSCIKGIAIQQDLTGIKRITSTDLLDLDLSSCSGGGVSDPPAPLAGQLALFSRELVDLLKTSPGCRMPFHKFIPSYHHHFGRQCRVADYGYTKLKELFEALPHVVQIMNEGSRAVITLAHRAQVKRFTSDLLRVLKSQASKQISLLELPTVFEKTLNKSFRASDYGVCDIEDILVEISETSVVLSGDGDDMLISIPKREQTLDEVERTRQFAIECVELLKHAPDCRLPFNKFIPAYHHHFGRQCRVADYGFTKLIELFEAVPGTIEVTEDADGERLLQLTDSERRMVVGDQIEMLMRNKRRQSMYLDELTDLYTEQYGYQLREDQLGKKAMVDFLRELKHILRIEGKGCDVKVRLIDREHIRALWQKVKTILIHEEDGKMALEEFLAAFEKVHGSVMSVDELRWDLSEWLCIVQDNGRELVQMLPIHFYACRIQELLKENQGKMLCSDLEAAFVERYSSAISPGQFGFQSVMSFIVSLPEYFVVRGRGSKKLIMPNKDPLAEQRRPPRHLPPKPPVATAGVPRFRAQSPPPRCWKTTPQATPTRPPPPPSAQRDLYSEFAQLGLFPTAGAPRNYPPPPISPGVGSPISAPFGYLSTSPIQSFLFPSLHHWKPPASKLLEAEPSPPPTPPTTPVQNKVFPQGMKINNNDLKRPMTQGLPSPLSPDPLMNLSFPFFGGGLHSGLGGLNSLGGLNAPSSILPPHQYAGPNRGGLGSILEHEPLLNAMSRRDF